MSKTSSACVHAMDIGDRKRGMVVPGIACARIFENMLFELAQPMDSPRYSDHGCDVGGLDTMIWRMCTVSRWGRRCNYSDMIRDKSPNNGIYTLLCSCCLGMVISCCCVDSCDCG